MKNILVTGAAGFIGSNLVETLLATTEYNIFGIDNFDGFYSAEQKLKNISGFAEDPRFHLFTVDIRDRESLFNALGEIRLDAIIHLAAKAGVRPSIVDPAGYIETNVLGTQNLLDLAVKSDVEQFVFASSSSVYGINPTTPWHEDDAELQPISPYAATKLSGEFLGSIYSRIYNKRFIGLRFFTVYGPRQRPDLAIHKFTKRILSGEEIEQYGDGSTSRDYTYVTDTVSGIVAALHYQDSMYEVINLGNNTPVTLTELINTIQRISGVKASIKKLPEQQGDVPVTYADISKAQQLLGYKPTTTLEEGIYLFIEWYRNNAKS